MGTGSQTAQSPVVLNASGMAVGAFISAQDGWLATASSLGWTLAATTNGGSGWHRVFSTVPLAPAYGVSLVNGTLGYGLGSARSSNGDVVLRTDNGGSTWTVIGQVPLTGGSPAVSFVTAQTGWVLGGEQVWGTTDGGAHWTSLATGLMAGGGPPAHMDFVNTRDGCVGGGPPNVNHPDYLMTTDGGRTWTAAQSQLSLWACAARAAGLGAPATTPYCAQHRTTFGAYLVPLGYGESYVGPTSTESGGNLRVAWLQCWIGTEVLYVSTNGGRTWSGHGLAGALPSCDPFSFTSGRDGWCFDAGSLLRTTDGGAHWSTVGQGVRAG
jgi:photosystem II stability/assembly factor-like uncharacterized protein